MTLLPLLSLAFEGNLDVLRAHFEGHAALDLGQSWRESPEAGFAPGRVWLGQDGDSLLVFVHLCDETLVSTATVDGQRLWELGDCFEIFLGPGEQAPYLEIHLEPRGHTLQLAWGALGNADPHYVWEDVVVDDILSCSRVWAQPQHARWFALAQIPFARFLPPDTLAFRFSLSRYDYSAPDERPILSSTSRHAPVHRAPDGGWWPSFHNRAQWGSAARCHAEDAPHMI